MVYSISANVAGTWRFQDFDTVTEAVAVIDEWHKLGALPVHIKKDGVLMEDSDELDRLLAEEAAQADPT